MQSNKKFLQMARNIVKTNPKLFETLVEFEKTGKIRTKTKLTFTIDKTIAMQFKKFCREKGYNMSAKIEQAMKQIIGIDLQQQEKP